MAKTKDKIKKTARKLFLEKGFEATTMRDIAKEASVALGSAYYYFKGKDEIILEFYLEKQDQVEKKAQDIINQNHRFQNALVKIFFLQYDVLADSKSFLHVLVRSAIDPKNPLSPLNKNTSEIRKKNLDIFTNLIEKANLKLKPELKAQLPYLLWSLQMFLIYIWINDASENAKNSKTLSKTFSTLVANLIKISKIPFASKIVNNVLKISRQLLTIFPDLAYNQADNHNDNPNDLESYVP